MINKLINVGLIGQTNAGKSTFINSMVGEKILRFDLTHYEQITSDQINAIERLSDRTKHEEEWQSEVTIFASDPAESIRALRKALGSNEDLRCIEAFDIAHLQGTETVASKVTRLIQ